MWVWAEAEVEGVAVEAGAEAAEEEVGEVVQAAQWPLALEWRWLSEQASP